MSNYNNENEFMTDVVNVFKSIQHIGVEYKKDEFNFETLKADELEKFHNKIIQSIDMSTMENLEALLNYWIKNNKNFKTTNLWQFLHSNGIRLFWFPFALRVIIEHHQSPRYCILAARLYLLILCVPGSLQFFNEMIFRCTVNQLRKWKDCTSKNSKELSRHERARNRNKDNPFNDDDDDVIEDNETVTNWSDTSLIADIKLYLNTCDQWLSTDSIAKTLNNTTHLFEVVCELIDISQNHSDICQSALLMLKTFLMKRNEEDFVMFQHEIFKIVLPYLVFQSCKQANIPKKLMYEHKIVLEFISSILKENMNHEIVVLMQHMILRCCDKAQYRTAISSACVTIVSKYPSSLVDVTKFMKTMSKSNKSGHRLLAVGFTVEYLRQNAQTNIEHSNTTEMAHLFNILLERCNDKVATVRAQALVAISDILDTCKNMLWMKQIMAKENTVETNSNQILLSNIIQMLHRRAADTKPVVRRAALRSLEMLILSVDSVFSRISLDDLQVFYDASCDEKSSIRRQSIESLSNLLLQFPDEPLLHKVWLGAILPLSNDKESSVQEKCLKIVDQILLKDIVSNVNNIETCTAIQIFNVMNEEMLRFFQQALNIMLNKNFIIQVQQLYKAVNNLLNMETNQLCIWVIAQEITCYKSKMIKKDHILKAWQKFSSYNPNIKVCILRCLEEMKDSFDDECVQKLIHKLVKLLWKFDENTRIIQSLIHTLSGLTKLSHSKNFKIMNWESETIEKCHNFINQYLKNQNINTDELVCYLFTIGCIVLNCDHIQIHNNVKECVKSLLPTTLAINGKPVPIKVRAYAFMTIGKFCLTDIHLAKECMPLMIRELQNGECDIIRNNILVVFCDLCRTFSTVVDNYMEPFIGCLSDKNIMIRRHCVMILMQLLQEDFIKWKPYIFYRLLRSLVDENIEVSKFASESVSNILKTKYQQKAQSHFIGALFYFNDNTYHSKYATEDIHYKQFSLSGSQFFNQRMKIYKFLLAHMTDEQKFSINIKLCQDVLGSIVDHRMPLNNKTINTVRDILIIMSSSDIKIENKKSNDVENDEEETSLQMEAARDRIISKLVKKNAMENILPVVLELKQFLEKEKSPVLKYLMKYLKELVSDYRNEIYEFLGHDKQLATELEYDIRQYEKKKQQSENEQELQRLNNANIYESPINNNNERHENSRLNSVSKLMTPRLIDKNSSKNNYSVRKKRSRNSDVNDTSISNNNIDKTPTQGFENPNIFVSKQTPTILRSQTRQITSNVTNDVDVHLLSPNEVMNTNQNDIEKWNVKTTPVVNTRKRRRLNIRI